MYSKFQGLSCQETQLSTPRIMNAKVVFLMLLCGTTLVLLLSTAAYAQYIRTDLLSNQPGVAPTTDQQGSTKLKAASWIDSLLKVL